MIVYCFLLCIVGLIVFLKKEHYRVNDKFVCSCLIIVSGFRFMVGIDYENYMNGYIYPETILYEPIWYAITKCLNLLGLSFQSFFLFTTTIIVVCTYRAAKKFDSSIAIVALFLFAVTNLFIESMNLVRQYVAMSLTFLAFVYRIDGENIKYLLLIGLATACHMTAIICLPIFEIVRYKYNRSFQLALVITSLFIGEVLSSYIIDLLSSYMDSAHRYSSYLVNKSYLVVTTGAYKYVLNTIALYFIIRQNKILDTYVAPVLNLFIISVCMYNVFLSFDVAIRLSKYFFYFIILLIPSAQKKCKSVYDKLIIILISVALLLFTLKDVSGTAYTPFQFNYKILK